MKAVELVRYAENILSSRPNDFAKKWVTDDRDDYREEVPGGLATFPGINPDKCVGTAHATTFELLGYRGNVVVKMVNWKDNWMYCEAELGKENLHYQEREYGPNGRGEYGAMLVKEQIITYQPIVYDLSNFVPYQLSVRFDTSICRNRVMTPLAFSTLRALITQGYDGDKIIQALRSEPFDEGIAQVIRRLKIKTKNTGGRWIKYKTDDKEIDVSIGQLVALLWDQEGQASTPELRTNA